MFSQWWQPRVKKPQHVIQPHPKDTLRVFTQPSIDDWAANSDSIRHAVIAICQIDILCEHFLRFGLCDEKQFRAARDAFLARAPIFQLVRDVHDTHKHGPLGRFNATIKSGVPASQHVTGDSYVFSPLGTEHTKTTALFVESESKKMRVSDVISEALPILLAEIKKKFP